MLENIHHFQGCFHVKHLPKSRKLDLPASYIFYSQSHWTGCLLVDQSTCLYFDSFAQGILDPEIVSFLSSFSFHHVKCNKLKIQDDESKLCGLYVTIFVAVVDSIESFKQFLMLFYHEEDHLFLNDKICFTLINLLK